MTILSTLRNHINRGISSTINAARSAATSTANFIRDSISQTAGYARDSATGNVNRTARGNVNLLEEHRRQNLLQANRSNFEQAAERGTNRFADTEQALEDARRQHGNRFASSLNQIGINNRQNQSFGPVPDGFHQVNNLNDAHYVEFLGSDGSYRLEDARRFIKVDGETEDNILASRESDDELQQLIDDHDVSRRFLAENSRHSRVQTDTGGFFPFVLKPDVRIKPKINSNIFHDIRKIGVFTGLQLEMVEKNPSKENCMILCLKNHVPEEKLEQIEFNTVTRLAEIKNICERIGMGIDIITFKNKSKGREITRYGTQEQRANKVIKIGLYLNHYFEVYKLEGIKYETIKKCLWRGRVLPRNFKRDNDIDTLDLLRLMYENKEEYFLPHNSNAELFCGFTHFTEFKGKFLVNEDSREKKEKKKKESNQPITENQKPVNQREEPSTSTSESDEDLSPMGEEIEKYIQEEDEQNIDENGNSFTYDAIWYGDFETTTDGDKHEPYLLSIMEENRDLKPEDFSEENLQENLNKIKKKYMELLGNEIKDGIENKNLKNAMKIEEEKGKLLLNGNWDDYEIKTFRSIDKDKNGEPINMVKECLQHMANKFFDRHSDVKNAEKGKKLRKMKKILVYFHNLGYDAKFLLQNLYFIAGKPNVIQKSRANFVTMQVVYSNTIFNFVDSLGMIASKLDDFQKMFGLEEGKLKDFPYHKYNSFSIKTKEIIVQEDEWLNEKYWKSIHGKEKYYTVRTAASGKNVYFIDRWKFAIDYCNQDILTLRNGMLIFKIWIEIIFGKEINFNSILTIGSLSLAIQKKRGVFDNVWEITGKTRAFIQESIIGGRTMPALHKVNNKYFRAPQIGNYSKEKHSFESLSKKNYVDSDKKYLTKDSINFDVSKLPKKKNQDFEYKEESGKTCKYVDKVSLYPAAMIKMPGYVTGKPTQITKERLENRKFMQSNYYVVQIKITKVRRKLRVPLLNKKFSKKDEKIYSVNCAGNRNWTNDMEGEVVIADKFTLEDFIKYHKIEWEPILGLEFFGEFNPKINEVIQEMFDVRKFFKKIKNPAEQLFKLIMNSGYGKTYERPHILARMFIPLKTPTGKPRDLKWINQKFAGCLESCVSYGIYNLITYRKSFVCHYNRPHCGGMVLSWAKRIMQEPMDIIDDYIIYTDTDSIVVEKEGYRKLLELRPDLIGEDIHQFHDEIDLDGEDALIIDYQFSSPKCYFYTATGYETIKNEKTGKKERTYNIVFNNVAKIKGIPKATIKSKIEGDFRGNVSDLFTAMQVWEDGVHFNIAYPRVRFLHKPNGDIVTVHDQIKKIRTS